MFIKCLVDVYSAALWSPVHSAHPILMCLTRLQDDSDLRQKREIYYNIIIIYVISVYLLFL